MPRSVPAMDREVAAVDVHEEDRRPLAGVTVLDLTTALAGPYCTLLLAGLGATVLKVENPAGGETARNNAPYLGRDGVTLSRESAEDISLALLDRNRNKYGVTLDLKHPDAPAVLRDLVAACDVMVTNFSPAALVKLGVDYDSIRAIDPSVVYCTISGFGADSPPERGKAMDTMIQAMSGLMMTSGKPGDGPTRVGVPVADVTAPLYAALGIVAGLRRAERTGEGDHLDVSMLGSVTAMVALEHWSALEQLGLPTRTGNVLPRLTPFGIFGTRDEQFVAICAPTDALAAGLFRAMGIDDPASDPRLATRDGRVANSDEVTAMIEGWTQQHTRDDLVEILAEHNVPVTEVRQPKEAVADPLLLARGETLPIEHPVHGKVADVFGTGMPIRAASGSYGFERDAPGLGEHNDEAYGEVLGYSADRIERLRADGVI